MAVTFAHFPGADFTSLASLTPEVSNYIAALPAYNIFDYGNITRDAILSQVSIFVPFYTICLLF